MYKYVLFVAALFVVFQVNGGEKKAPKIFKANITPNQVVEKIIEKPVPVPVVVGQATGINWQKVNEIANGTYTTESTYQYKDKCAPLLGEYEKKSEQEDGVELTEEEKRNALHAKLSAMIECNNEASSVYPTSSNFYNTIQKFPYHSGMQYQIITALGQTTDIQFQAGETIKEGGIYLGNTSLYQLGGAISGSDEMPIYHLNLKPIHPNQKTNLKVYTSRRVYFFDLISMDQGEGYLSGVSFSYPNEPVSLFVNQSNSGVVNKGINTQSATTPAFVFDIAEANYNYEIKLTKGKKPSWYPLRILDNGRETYIEFKSNAEMPAVYIEYEEGKGLIPQFRPYGSGVIIAQIADVIVLRDGSDEDDNVKEIKITRR